MISQEVTVGTLIGKGRDLANMIARRTVAILCVQETNVREGDPGAFEADLSFSTMV